MNSRNLDFEFRDNESRKYQYGFDLEVRKRLLSRWLPHLDAGRPSLEMGSFDGSMTSLLLEELSDLEIVEGSAELARLVHERLGSLTRVNTSLFEEFAPSRLFRQIFLVHGLEHLDDPVKVLASAATWLEPDGVLLVAVPNARALSRLIAVEMGIVDSPESVTAGEKLHGHRVTFTSDSLRSTVESANLHVIEEGGVVLKTLANFQFDLAMAAGIVDEAYIDACDALSRSYPDFSSSIYVVATSKDPLAVTSENN